MPEKKSRLHTDELEQKYGVVHAEIIEHTNDRRIINILDGGGVTRTHAVTWFPRDLIEDDPLAELRKEIAEGALIGKTFRKYGFEVEKPEIIAALIEIPECIKEAFQTDENMAWVNIYYFIGVKEGLQPQIYGVVCEIDSPDFMAVPSDWVDNKTENSWLEKLRGYLIDL